MTEFEAVHVYAGQPVIDSTTGDIGIVTAITASQMYIRWRSRSRSVSSDGWYDKNNSPDILIQGHVNAFGQIVSN